MVGAIAVYALLYRLGTRRAQPWQGGEFALPTQRRIDASLVTGAAIFGVGRAWWGCAPGPRSRRWPPAVAACSCSLPQCLPACGWCARGGSSPKAGELRRSRPPREDS